MATKKKEEGVELGVMTVRQFFYFNEQRNEKLIKALERSYKESTKTKEEWVDIMLKKKIIFK